MHANSSSRPRTVWKSFKAKYVGEDYLHANSSSRPHAVWKSSKAKAGIRTNICAKAQPSFAGIRRKCSRARARRVRGVVLIRLVTAKTKRDGFCHPFSFLVETTGIEPVTSCMSSKHSNQLSYASATTCIITHLFSKSNTFLKKILPTIKNS